MTDPASSSEFGDAFDRGLAAAPLQTVTTREGTTAAVAVVPEGYRPVIVDTRPEEDRLRRKIGTIDLHQQGDFIAYVTRHREERSLIVADLNGAMTCYFDHHDPVGDGDAGWGGRGEHSAEFVPRRTRSWEDWSKSNQRWLSQQEFLEFIDRRMGDILEPDGADLREIVEFFRVHTEIGFESGRNLTNGNVSLRWAEESNATGGQNLEVPTRFKVLIKPYRDLDDSQIFDVELRWRISKPAVTFGFLLPEAVEDFIDTINERRRVEVNGATNVPVLLASNVSIGE